MLVLGIESSCDETSVAIVENGHKIISELTHSQIATHQVYGGVVPEIAAREHVLRIDHLIWSCLKNANLNWSDINRIAVVNGPGLVSSLLVGINAAKTLSWALNIELVSINHLKAHICANNLNKNPKDFLQESFICLLASGGHTQILQINNYQDIKILGQTIDDSAGEAFDKVARMLNLPYPGGPHIETLAKTGNKTIFKLPRAKVGEFDFSFSGLKTAVLRLIEKTGLENLNKADLAASFQEAVCHELADKLIKASLKNNCFDIVIAGGVSANQRLRELISEKANELNIGQKINIKAPFLNYCTDNGAMVAAAGYLCPESFGLDFGVYSRAK